MVGDREPVGLVADPLEQVEPLATTAPGSPGPPRSGSQTSSSRLARPQTGMSSMPSSSQRRAGRPPPAAGRRRRPRARGRRRTCAAARSRGRPASGRYRPVATSVAAGLLVEQPPEPPGDHLVHRRDVVLAVDALDHEPAVLALAGQAVLEDHHRGDHLGALEVGDVVALDPQRHLVERQRLLDLLERPVAGRQVAGRAWSCAAPATGRRCGPRSPAGSSCRRAAAPGSRPGSPAARRAAPRTSSASGGSAGTRISRGMASPSVVRRRRAGAGSPRPARACRPPRRGRRPSRAGRGSGRRARRRSAPRPRAGPRRARSRRRRCRRRARPPASPAPCSSAPRSSRSRAAFSKSSASEAAYISRLDALDERPGLAGHEVAEVVDDLRGAPRR